VHRAGRKKAAIRRDAAAAAQSLGEIIRVCARVRLRPSRLLRPGVRMTCCVRAHLGQDERHLAVVRREQRPSATAPIPRRDFAV
jgi:hypothetical protein